MRRRRLPAEREAIRGAIRAALAAGPMLSVDLARRVGVAARGIHGFAMRCPGVTHHREMRRAEWQGYRRVYLREFVVYSLTEDGGERP